MIKHTSRPTKLKKFSIKPNPKMPINKAETTAPANSVSKNVNAKNEEVSATNPPSVKHLPYSQIHSFVSFLFPKAAVLYSKINVIIANIIPIISGTAIIPAAIVPVKNKAPITIPNITAITTGNMQTL